MSKDTTIERVHSGAPWEAVAGYCRAVRVGAQVYVSGTTAVAEDGSVWAPGDAGAQTRRCLEIIQAALAKLGDARIVRTRMYVTDISRWEEIARVHGEVLGSAPPAATMVEVQGLIDPEMLIEIEVDAVMLG